MIIQGSNLPIIIPFEEDTSDIKDLSVSLFGENKRGDANVLLKHWGKDDVVIEEGSIIAPMSEGDTLGFIPGVAVLEAKWLSQDDNIYPLYTSRIRICGRADQTRLTS